LVRKVIWSYDSIYSPNLSDGISEWRSSFLDPANLQLGHAWWRSEEEEVIVYTRFFGDNYLGAVYKGFEAEPGLLHRAEIHMKSANAVEMEAHLLLFNMAADTFTVNSAFTIPPFDEQYFYHVQDSILVIEFVPSHKTMTLAVAGTMFHPGAFTLDDVRIYAIDALDREVLLHDDFNTRDSTAPWRNSLLPKDETLRTFTLGGLSHDSTHQRMRIDLLPDEMSAPEDDPSVMGLAARQYCSLQAGREYLVSFQGRYHRQPPPRPPPTRPLHRRTHGLGHSNPLGRDRFV
jgi:hypothetical protein